MRSTAARVPLAPCVFAIVMAIAAASGLHAQAPGSGSASIPPTQAQALPLSGRNTQAGAAVSTQSPVSSFSSTVDTLASSIQSQGPVLGSTGTGTRPLAGPLSLQNAIDRGLTGNLATVVSDHAVRRARSEQAIARSGLYPNVVAYLSDVEQKVNLAASGVSFEVPIPGFTIPEIVGPFNVSELRARLTQTVVGLTVLNNYRAARESVRATELSAQDSRELVVFAVGGAYLQTAAARARLRAAQAQVDTTTAVFRRTSERRTAGLATPVEASRAQIQMLTAQQRLVSLQTDFSKQKIDLARMIALPPTDEYDLADEVPFSAAPVLTIEQAVSQAMENRSDLRAAEAQVRAAERALTAARAARLPSLNVTADYGGSLATASPLHSTYMIAASLRVPVWEGGRVDGEISRASTALVERQAELEDLKADIAGEVRKAYLDLRAAASQVDLAQVNLRMSRDNLALTKQSFDAGVSDNVAVVQSEEIVAAAELDSVDSVLSHNLAKLSLARVIGRASRDLSQFLKLP